MAGPHISTARQRETEKLKAHWERKKATRSEELRQQYGEGFRGFDDVGEPIIDGNEARSLRGPELIKALERALLATGDPVFDDALRAVRSYGLDQGGHKRLVVETWGGGDTGYLTQVRFLVERRRMSSRAATEQVVCKFFADGSSFESAVDRIRKKFDKWKRSGYAAEDINFEAGNLGYWISVEPTAGTSLEALMQPLPTKGKEQPATGFWRRLFREGAVSIRYLGEK